AFGCASQSTAPTHTLIPSGYESLTGKGCRRPLPCRYNGLVTVSSWQPADLLERVAREPIAVLRKGIGAAPFLIVRLDDFSNDLGVGLAAADEAANRQRFNRALKSTLQLSPGMTEQLRVMRTQEVFLPKGGEEDDPQRGGFPVPEWLNVRCYVVRLSNRADGATPLSIGRDTSHKIVLQHPSVSATHAHLTVGAELSLRDAQSRNGTFINGAQVKGAIPLQVGDRIKFGAVHTVLCSADDLWHAVR
ncbi:MAG: FHA domain-containing protein, partial [Polyangiales bacterium]